jgi:2-polyprenyl-3-methyl-5-hydroxy-6-metoxy-1,4-benzoquinol methylase
MDLDKRIRNEQEHGSFIAREGEEIWNWSSPAGKIRWARRVAMYTAFIGNRKQKILEIGCGTGLFTAELATTDNLITAIDISPDLLELARRRVRSGNVTFMLENAYATSFPDNSFNYVVGSSVLHHLDLERALGECFRLLQPGGAFMFTEPNMLNIQIALQKNIPYLKRLAGDSPDETAFVRFTLIKKLKRAGFADLSVVPFDFVHPALPALVLGRGVPVLNFLEKVPLVREGAGSLVIRGTKPL